MAQHFAINCIEIFRSTAYTDSFVSVTFRIESMLREIQVSEHFEDFQRFLAPWHTPSQNANGSLPLDEACNL
jgi:hypothetical protein